jgi:hypothetical protein
MKVPNREETVPCCDLEAPEPDVNVEIPVAVVAASSSRNVFLESVITVLGPGRGVTNW